MDPTTRRRLQQEANRTNQVECDLCLDQPTRTPCEACKPIPPRLNGKSRRKRRRTCPPKSHGVQLAIDVITRRAGHKLRLLDLHLCYPFHHVSSYQMHNSDLKLLAQRSGSNLRGLIISPSVHLSAVSIVDFALSCRQLRVLHMDNCFNLDMAYLNVIVDACPLLEDISVSHCPQFRGQRLMNVLKPLRNTLRRIDLSFTPTEFINLTLLLNSFPALEEFVADHCSVLKCVVSHSRFVMQDFPPHNKLTTFRVDDTAFDFSQILLLFHCCKYLNCFSANHIPSSSRTALERVFDGHIPPLRILCVASLPISDSIWRRIFERLHDVVEFLNVSANSRLTLALHDAQAKLFSRLKGIYVMNTAATDRTLAQLILRSPKLTTIDANGCRGVHCRPFRRNPLRYRQFLESISQGYEPPLNGFALQPGME